MHPVLHIEEILTHIFSYCYTPGYHRQRFGYPKKRELCYANVHLTALARTCKAFKEPALNMIWSELDSGLAPLVRCLPKELWVKRKAKTGGKKLYALKRPLEQVEWHIILGYARRIQALPYLCDHWDLAADCVVALSKPPVDVLFPNLRIVGLDTPSATVEPLLRHLAHSKVTDIMLQHAEDLSTALSIFGRECPFVTDFYASNWTGNNPLSDLICQWQHLSSAHCSNTLLSMDTLFHLCRMRNLLRMSFLVRKVLFDQVCAAESSSPTLIFPALRELHLTSQSLVPVERLLRHFDLPVVRDLSVGLGVRPSALDITSFLATLQGACGHTSLSDLLLRVYRSGNKLSAPPAEDSSAHYINFRRLLPLTVFANMKSITLDVPYGVDMCENELLTLASSWPRLEVFEVANNHDWTPTSSITPEGFVKLLERCRSLRVLYFTLDTRGYTEIPQGHPWRGLSMPEHTYINLLNSPIEEESVEALGFFFHVAPYPSFSLSTHWNNYYFQGSARPEELCDLYYDRWVRAREFARYFWDQRRDLRLALEARCS